MEPIAHTWHALEAPRVLSLHWLPARLPAERHVPTPVASRDGSVNAASRPQLKGVGDKIIALGKATYRKMMQNLWWEIGRAHV